MHKPYIGCKHAGADFSLVGYGGRKLQVPKNKLTLLSKEFRGYISPKKISVNGTKLKVHSAELVIEKARKQELNLSDTRQCTLI